ncbi:MAG TPA: hypothetical protein VH914_18490 [Acidimicrobiia bacterium]|nr:hypothetical protein [Acidimicrobiia bacterium]
MNDDPNIEGVQPVDLSPTRAELITRVRARGRRIRARRRLAITGIAALIVVAIAVPAIAIGSGSSTHSSPPAATASTGHGDFRVSRVLGVRPMHPQEPGALCISSVDGQDCYVLGKTLITARDVVSAQVVHNPPAGWDVQVKITRAAGEQLLTLVNHRAAIVVGGLVISAPTLEPGVIPTTVEVSNHLTRPDAENLALDITGRVSTRPVTARIDLPGDHTYVTGTAVEGALVIDSETGKWWREPLLNGCPVAWRVELSRPGMKTAAPISHGCILNLKEWKGVVRFPFAMRTVTGSCEDAPVAASCVPGPPLPPGHYTAVLVTAGAGWPQPRGVPVTLVAAQPSR